MRPCGRELAAKTVSPDSRTPPTIMPGSRADQRTLPLCKLIAYTFRSMLPAYRVLFSIANGAVNRRPTREVHTVVGASPASVAETGCGGGRKFIHAALTLPSSRARLNAPRRRRPLLPDPA